MFTRGYHGKFPPAPRSPRSWAAMRSGTGATLRGGSPGVNGVRGIECGYTGERCFFCGWGSYLDNISGDFLWFWALNQFESIKGGGNDFQMAILIDGDVLLIGIQLPFLPVNFQVGAGQVLRWHGAGGSEKFQLKQGVLPFWKIGRFEYMDYLGGTFKWLAYAKFFHGPMDDQKNQGTPDFGNIWWSIPFSWLNFQGWRFHQHRGNQTWFHDEKQSTRKGIWVILSIPCGYSKFFFHQWCGLVSWQ